VLAERGVLDRNLRDELHRSSVAVRSLLRRPADGHRELWRVRPFLCHQ
jgi:hypothetical protein